MMFALEQRRRVGMAAAAALGALLVPGLAVASPAAGPAASAEVGAPAGSELYRVSRTDGGSSTQPFLTPDGQRVFFTSTAADLVEGDLNGASDVFVSVAAQGSADPFSGAAAIVSVPDDALEESRANGASSEPVASADGRYVAFTSAATNLVPGGGTPGRTSVYVRDTLFGKTFRVQAAAEPNGSSYDPDLTDDGRHLVFTSEATDLSASDTNEAPDSFSADLDADGDGILGDVSISRLIPSASLPGGTGQARISGNGANVVFVAHTDTLETGPPGSGTGDYLYHAEGPDAGGASLIARNAHSPSIDASGDTVAYIDDDDCDGIPAVIAATLETDHYFAAAGTIDTDRRAGYIADPVISPDGARVTWTTTVPALRSDAAAQELPAPVIRTQEIGWADSRAAVLCNGAMPGWTDLAEGSEASVSASARTVAFSAPSSAASTVFALDTHRHAGLSVSSTQGRLVTPGFMTAIDISTVPLAALRGYASAIANTPIHRLPIARLPIHRLPIHRLPLDRLLIEDSPIHRLAIHRLPMHRVDLPGGWDQVLAGTPFAGDLLQTVTLDEVLAWGDAALAADSTATESERAAATTIQSLTLGDVGVDGSGLDSLTLASYVLGAAPLAEVPIAGDGNPLERWQRRADAQGLGVTVDSTTALAELDAAGLSVERSGISAVPLRSLPVSRTLLGDLRPADLFLAGTPLGDVDVSTFDGSARLALVGDAAATGPLGAFSGAFLPDATLADLAAGAPESVTLGDLFLSMLDRDSYPWEQVSPPSIDPDLAEASTTSTGCDLQLRCEQVAAFRYAFDPGPGEPTRFAAPTATLATPAGTAPDTTSVLGSGPEISLDGGTPYPGPTQVDAERMRFPLPDTAGGTVLTIRSFYSATTQPGETKAVGELTSGALSASDELFGAAPLDSFDDPTRNLVDGEWQSSPSRLEQGQVYYEWISPQWRRFDDEGRITQGPAQDEDYYVVEAPPPGKRLIVSTDATDGRLSLSLYAPKSGVSALGVADAGPAPGTPVTEQNGAAGQRAPSGADARVALDGWSLIDQTVVGGEGTAQVEATTTDAAAGQDLLVRVTSGNDEPSDSLYSLRIRYLDEAPEVRCTPWTPAQTADPGVEGVSDPVTPSTNTVYLFDQKRYGDTYGAEQATRVRDALVSLTGDGHVGDGSIDGAVLSIDSDEAVRTAREALDGNPCAMGARAALSSAINAFVAQELGDERSHITSVVIVGGDDIIPLAPVQQRTSQFTEVGHADDLRLATLPDGSPCPAAASVDPCETPLSAAARTAHILTDDPYGLAKAYESPGGHLYVPTAGLGRLVESPDQIVGTIDRFLAADGRLAADSTLAAGYGPWSELPQKVSGSLAWRSAVNQQFGEAWNASDLEGRLFPEDAEAPRVVSINTLASETRMLPGAPRAASGGFSDDELFLASGHEDASQLAGSLIFGTGSHAGNNLPTAYYGPLTDWVDVFSQAGGYIGNTGYGLATDVTTALGERLLGLYADWIGVSVQGDQVSSGEALAYAKQSYLGGLGLYSAYDEKALMQAVYYGLPMYTFTDPLKTEMPLPEAPDLQLGTADGLTTAPLEFRPEFQQKTAPGGGRYYTVEGNAVAVPTAQGILPSIVRVLEPQPGLVPRGVLLTSLTSEPQTGAPALTPPTLGVPGSTATASGSAFPSSFATITHQDTPAGPVDLLVVTPARVQAGVAGEGTTELFTSFTAEVVYGPESASDTTPPVIDSVALPGEDGSDLEVRATDLGGGDIASAVLLVQPEGATEWQRLAAQEVVTNNPDGTVAERYWRATPPGAPFRWMLQVVDDSGNVTTDTSRGHLDVAGAPAPTLGDPGPDATIDLGGRLLRSVDVTDAVAGERLTAATTVTDAEHDVVSSAPATVETGPDGTTRALIDQAIATPGSFTVTLSVCRGEACATTSFGVRTPALDEAPRATVELTADDNPVEPTSTLTAHAVATDPDQDPVSVTYAWSRNGRPIPGQTGSTLALGGIAQTDDIIGVTVTPDDGTTPGHAASAEVLVDEEVAPPAEPKITATATTTSGAYAEGAWSRTAVTVSFSCTSGAPVAVCPDDVVVSGDTFTEGRVVSGTMTDLLGRSATAQILVRVDGTTPTLAATVAPATVAPGQPATAQADATDASSGVASSSCDAPQTDVEGEASVACRATDVAGNTARTVARYTVQTPPPDPPALTLTATNAAGAFADGAWSPSAVTVEFACASGVEVTSCPKARTVSSDTTAAGVLVAGMMEDAWGRTAAAQILVRIDRVAPELAPTLRPERVLAGATAGAAPNATDRASGVASQSCEPVDASEPGAKRLTCRATDVAGNTASAELAYIVGPAQRPRSVPPIFGPQPETRPGGADRGSDGGDPASSPGLLRAQ